MMRREALLLTILILLLIYACNYRMTSKASGVTATGGLPTLAPAPLRYALGVIPVIRRNVVVK